MDFNLRVVGLRYARIFKPGKQIALKYTVDAVPMTIVSYPTFRAEPLPNGNFRIIEERKTRYSWGISPLGLQINFGRQKKVQLFVTASGGFLYFTEKVPNPFGARFNFTADAGGGVQFMMRGKKAVTLGYKYQHFSNGYRALDNPGFDSNVFYIGLSLFK